MRKAILIVSLVLFSAFLITSLFGQASKRKPRARSKVTKHAESPCGIPIPTFAEAVEELKVEWRKINENDQSTWYYNTHRQVCEKGILKVWTKVVEKENLTYSIDRLEINCRSNQTRLTSSVKYRKDGSVLDSATAPAPEWGDVLPNSIGENVLETVCRKKL
jgi:hypothetical protein